MNTNEAKLRGLLKDIWNDKDFINGTICGLEDEEYIVKMIEFIEMSREMGDHITSDDVLLLTVVFDKEREKNESIC